MIHDYARAYGLGYTVLRYFNAAGADPGGDYGEDRRHEGHLIPLVLHAAVGKRPKVMIYGTDYPTRDGTCERDYIHTADLALAHQLAIEAIEPGKGRAYNVGTGAGATVLEVLRACEEAVGRPIPHEFAGRRPGDPPVLIGSADRLRSELGWSPRYPDIRQIVRTAWDWHRRHPDGFSTPTGPAPTLDRARRRHARPMKTIAYVLPTYPMPSQTFIRREIAALEARGWTVHRFAMRRFGSEMAEPADRAEQERTEYILDGRAALVRAVAAEALGRPRRWLSALSAAVRMGRRSEKGLLRHLAYLAEACYLRRRLAGIGARHLHAHFGTNAAAVAMLGRLLGGPPYSITMHGPEEFDAPGRWPWARRRVMPPSSWPSATSRAASSAGGARPPTGRRSTWSAAAWTGSSWRAPARPSRTGRGWSAWAGWPSRRASSCWSRRRRG